MGRMIFLCLVTAAVLFAGIAIGDPVLAEGGMGRCYTC